MFPVGQSSRSHFQPGKKINLDLKQWSSPSRTNVAFLDWREREAATGALGFTFDTSWRALRRSLHPHARSSRSLAKQVSKYYLLRFCSSGVSCGRCFIKRPGSRHLRTDHVDRVITRGHKNRREYYNERKSRHLVAIQSSACYYGYDTRRSQEKNLIRYNF